MIGYIILIAIIIGEFYLVKAVYSMDGELLRERIERGEKYIRERSQYFSEADLDLKGKLQIEVIEVEEGHPIIVELTDKDDVTETICFDKKCFHSYSGVSYTKIRCLSKYTFRFASDFEAGMEHQEASIYAVCKDGTQIPCEVEGWDKGWIILFDKKY